MHDHHHDDRRKFIKHSLLTLGAVSTLGGMSALAQEGKKYVCPPCGCAADGKEFDKPGPCPECGMQMMEKGGTPPQGAADIPKVAIFVFNGVEIIDFAAPYEVFGAAGYDVFTVGESGAPVTTAMGLSVTPRYAFQNCPKVDVLVTPGGNISRTLSQHSVLSWIRERNSESRHTMSVCNGAFFLAKSGLLDGKRATTFYSAIAELRTEYPRITVVSDRRFVDNGQVITTAGLSSGIDGALHVVSVISGHGTAQLVALGLEYDWKADGTYARASFADAHIRAIFGPRLQLELADGYKDKVENTQGDRERWDASWKITTTRSAPELLEEMRRAIATRSKWQELSGEAKPTHAAFSFKDREARAWRGELATTKTDGDTLSAHLGIRLMA
jgi:transcriptional regulator GlxA family with amidase domain